MGLLFSSSFETASFADWTAISGTPVQDTGTVFDGANSCKCAAGTDFVSHTETVALGTTIYQRTYFNKSGNPAATTPILRVRTSADAQQYDVRLTTTGTLILTFNGAAIGSASAALSNGQWYRVELSSKIASGASDDSGELRLDGSTVASETNVTRSTTAQNKMQVTGVGFSNVFHDAYELRDDTWPGPLITAGFRPVFRPTLQAVNRAAVI